MRVLTVLVSFLVLVACGGGAPPTAPSAPSAPPVGPAPTPQPTPAAPPTPIPSPTPPPTPDPGPVVLRSATLDGANGHVASGMAEIVRRGSSHSLEFRNNFRIDGGVNEVYLARNPGLDMGGDLRVGDLAKLQGAQSYPLPGEGAAYRYVIIWCRPFRIPIGVGDLR